MKFYLGTHLPNWLGKIDVPLFVSNRRLFQRKTLPVASHCWALDSGGFTELSMYGRWTLTSSDYCELVNWYQSDIGKLDWAAPQDWMCEPRIIEHTGLTIREHQERTVQNYLDLFGKGPFIPVLQGWTLDDYMKCVDLYREAGIDLSKENVVGVGSVCRRQSTSEIKEIFTELSSLGIACHGFGVKLTGIKNYGHHMVSSDSLAWSYNARRETPLEGCVGHKNCANCKKYALQWYEKVTNLINEKILVGGY